MSKEKVVAIIQARMGSTRLPGKVMMDIIGRPMLWHVGNRVSNSRLVDKIVVATSITKQNDCIESFCKKNEIDFYRGSEENVLDRYYQTAKNFKADIIARITADCPLIDPEVIDKVILSYLNNRNFFDGTSNTIDRTYPRGMDVEVISFEALKKCWKKADEQYQKEHLTPYIYEHSEIFNLKNVKHEKDLSDLRLTVDEEKDLELIRKIYSKLYKEDDIFYLNDIIKLFKENPELIAINKKVKQKPVKQ